MREEFETSEYYHVYNKTVDSVPLLSHPEDIGRFLQSMDYFNSITPIGSIFEHSFFKQKYKKKNPPLVHIICYCINPNHYHFILQQKADRGVEKFMQRMGIGFTKYYNQRHRRQGPLFIGGYRSKLIETNEYLLHVSAYVNLNHKVHQLGNRISKSSWDEYTSLNPLINPVCQTDSILEQFASKKEYASFALDALQISQEKKEMKALLLE